MSLLGKELRTEPIIDEIEVLYDEFKKLYNEVLVKGGIKRSIKLRSTARQLQMAFKSFRPASVSDTREHLGRIK
jgi:hypothetical protein